jgi:hypothetical protein
VSYTCLEGYDECWVVIKKWHQITGSPQGGSLIYDYALLRNPRTGSGIRSWFIRLRQISFYKLLAPFLASDENCRFFEGFGGKKKKSQN